MYNGRNMSLARDMFIRHRISTIFRVILLHTQYIKIISLCKSKCSKRFPNYIYVYCRNYIEIKKQIDRRGLLQLHLWSNVYHASVICATKFEHINSHRIDSSRIVEPFPFESYDILVLQVSSPNQESGIKKS